MTPIVWIKQLGEAVWAHRPVSGQIAHSAPLVHFGRKNPKGYLIGESRDGPYVHANLVAVMPFQIALETMKIFDVPLNLEVHLARGILNPAGEPVPTGQAKELRPKAPPLHPPGKLNPVPLHYSFCSTSTLSSITFWASG
jgi:hypothetical protein